MFEKGPKRGATRISKTKRKASCTGKRADAKQLGQRINEIAENKSKPQKRGALGTKGAALQPSWRKPDHVRGLIVLSQRDNKRALAHSGRTRQAKAGK